MRVAISGTHCCGKTTLIEAFLAMKLHKVISVLLVIISVSANSCSRKTSIKLVSNSTPPSFEITGRATLDWIWFQGPYQNPREPAPKIKSGPDPEEIIVWKISPPGYRFIPMSEVPKITYGVLPEGWEQDKPRRGSPPALLDGYVYYVGVIAARGGGAVMCVFIKNGKAQPFEDDDERAGCGRKG